MFHAKVFDFASVRITSGCDSIYISMYPVPSSYFSSVPYSKTRITCSDLSKFSIENRSSRLSNPTVEGKSQLPHFEQAHCCGQKLFLISDLWHMRQGPDFLIAVVRCVLLKARQTLPPFSPHFPSIETRASASSLSTHPLLLFPGNGETPISQGESRPI